MSEQNEPVLSEKEVGRALRRVAELQEQESEGKFDARGTSLAELKRIGEEVKVTRTGW